MYVVERFARLGRQRIRIRNKLWDDIYKCVDAALKLKKLVKHNDLFLFEDAIAALKCSPFVPDNIFYFAEEFFQLVKSVLRVFHRCEGMERRIIMPCFPSLLRE